MYLSFYFWRKPLDQLLPNNVSQTELLDALDRTHAWEERSLNEHLKNTQNQAIYAVGHGGTDHDLRKKSIEHLMSLSFDGLAIGLFMSKWLTRSGGSLGKNHDEMQEVLSKIGPILPNDKPVHLLGIGDPQGIENSVQYGIG